MPPLVTLLGLLAPLNVLFSILSFNYHLHLNLGGQLSTGLEFVLTPCKRCSNLEIVLIFGEGWLSCACLICFKFIVNRVFT